MNYNELKRAQQKATELMKYEDQTKRLSDFAKMVEESSYLYLITVHQEGMWNSAKETFELIGKEVLALIYNKIDERAEYLESITPSDLINVESNPSID